MLGEGILRNNDDDDGDDQDDGDDADDDDGDDDNSDQEIRSGPVCSSLAWHAKHLSGPLASFLCLLFFFFDPNS